MQDGRRLHLSSEEYPKRSEESSEDYQKITFEVGRVSNMAEDVFRRLSEGKTVTSRKWQVKS